ncbi:MAG: DUF3540 domain-containing protein [Myxococcota bacterium]
MEPKRRSREETATLRTEGGAEVGVARSPGGERIYVANAEGALLFEYLPAEGRSVVYSPDGDLSFRAPKGSIELQAADEVTLRGRRAVTMESAEGVHLFIHDVQHGAMTFFNLVRRGAVLVAPRLETRADTAKLQVEEAELEGKELRSKFDRARMAVGVLETKADRILETAKEAYRETEGLSQTKAGRLRLVAEKTIHALGDRTLLKARKDMKLHGEKIYIA